MSDEREGAGSADDTGTDASTDTIAPRKTDSPAPPDRGERYDAAAIEEKWRERWEREDLYRTDDDAPGEKWAVSAADSDLVNGKLVFTNTTRISLADGTTPTRNGRLTVTIVDDADKPIPFDLTSTLGIHACNIGVPLLLDVLREQGLRTEAPLLDERQERLKADFTANRGYWHEFWDGLLGLDPDFFEAYLEFSSEP